MAWETFYSDNPWAGLDKNQLENWYVPGLLATFRRRSVFRAFTPTSVDLSTAANRARRLTYTMVYDFEPNTNVIDNRAMWVEPMQTDSAELSITTERHGHKVQLHKYDDSITYWTENGRQGLMPIIRDRMGQSITKVNDFLIRNAYLNGYNKSYMMGRRTNFNDIAATDLFDIDWALEAQLRAMTMELPGFDGTLGSIACITTPGAIYNIQRSDDWVELQKYTDAGLSRLFTGEIGSYKGVRFVTTNAMMLWNAGNIVQQNTIAAAAGAGAGGADWATYRVGQAASVKYLQLDDFDSGDYNVDDVVTISDKRTSKWGVTNSADWEDGKTWTRIVKSVNAGANQIGLDRPIFWDMDTPKTGGEFGYVTRGRHIHASLFVCGPGGVVAGVTQPPKIYLPPAIDDYLSMWRMSWDEFYKAQEFRPEWFEVTYHAGHHRISGVAKTE